jgi:hypothetical protein
LVPLVYLPGGKTKNGEWAICVPQSQAEDAVNQLESGYIPTVDAVMTCINSEGQTSFFEVSMRDFESWRAPNIFEEVERSFDLPDGSPLDRVEGTKPMPIKGVVFTDEWGNPFVHVTEEGKKVPLRYNLTNYEDAGGTVSDDGRVWSIKIGETEYTGHLWLVNTENAMRIFGSIAYVRCAEKGPDRVIVCESAGSIAQFVGELLHLRSIVLDAGKTIENLRKELEIAHAAIRRAYR